MPPKAVGKGSGRNARDVLREQLSNPRKRSRNALFVAAELHAVAPSCGREGGGSERTRPDKMVDWSFYGSSLRPSATKPKPAE